MFGYDLLQVGVGSSVIELNGADSTKEVVVAGMLRVSRRRRECSLQNKLVGLVIEVIMEVVTEQQIKKCFLHFIVILVQDLKPCAGTNLYLKQT